jgi:hypothetical protein
MARHLGSLGLVNPVLRKESAIRHLVRLILIHMYLWRLHLLLPCASFRLYQGSWLRQQVPAEPGDYQASGGLCSVPVLG